MKKLSLSVYLLLLTFSSFSQQYKWGNFFDGPSNNVSQWCMDVDAAGNQYIVGAFDPSLSYAEIDLNPGSGTFDVNSNQGLGFYAKYDPNGNFIWGKSVEMPFSGIKIMPNGNIMLYGNYPQYSQYDVDPGAGTIYPNNSYGNDLILCTYSSNTGGFLNIRQFKTASSASTDGVMPFPNPKGQNIGFDATGNMYLCGWLKGLVDLGITDPNFNNTYDFGNGTGYIFKYDINGNLLSGRIFPNSIISSFRLDGNNNIIYAGKSPYISSNIPHNILIGKLNSNVDSVWEKTLPFTSSPYGSMYGSISGLPENVLVDNANNYYIGGILTSVGINFDPDGGFTELSGPSQAIYQGNYLAKYNTLGHLVWAKNTGSTTMEMTSSNKLAAVVGSVSGTPYSYLNMQGATIDTTGVFLAMYDTAASLLQYKRISFTYTSAYSYSFPSVRSFKVHGQDIYLTGTFNDSCDFDPLTTRGKSISNNLLRQTPFTVKYNQCPDIVHNTTVYMCKGGTYTFGTQTLSSPGKYTNATPAGSCDSVVVLTLKLAIIDTSVTYSNGTLTANASNATYKWINCDNNTVVQGTVNRNFAPAASGNYKVAVTQNGCTDTSNCYAINVTGIHPTDIAKNINIYPNPVSDLINISYGANYEIQHINIIDIVGRNMKYALADSSHSNISLDVKSLQPGVYFLKLEVGGEQIVYRFSKL